MLNYVNFTFLLFSNGAIGSIFENVYTRLCCVSSLDPLLNPQERASSLGLKQLANLSLSHRRSANFEFLQIPAFFLLLTEVA